MSANKLTDRLVIIDRIFSYMSAMYGRKFTEMWHGTDIEEVKCVWGEKLTRYMHDPEIIKNAINQLDNFKYPPTLPEFLDICSKCSGDLYKERNNKRMAETLRIERKFTEQEITENKMKVDNLIKNIFNKYRVEK